MLSVQYTEGTPMTKATTEKRFTQAVQSYDRAGTEALRSCTGANKQQQEEPDHDTWFHEQVQRGLESANLGRLIDGSEVESRFAVKRALGQKIGNAE